MKMINGQSGAAGKTAMRNALLVAALVGLGACEGLPGSAKSADGASDAPAATPS